MNSVCGHCGKEIDVNATYVIYVTSPDMGMIHGHMLRGLLPIAQACSIDHYNKLLKRVTDRQNVLKDSADRSAIEPIVYENDTEGVTK